MKIGFMELAVVFVVALLLIGPDKLPAFAQKLGAALREFRRASADVSKDVRENVIEPLEDAQRPIREAMEPLEELDRDVRRNFREVERELKNIGKPAAGSAEKKEAAAEDAGEDASSDRSAPEEDAAELEAENILDNSNARVGGGSV